MALLAPARPRAAPATDGYHKLVVPMLANLESKRAVEIACRLAAERHAAIRIVTVIEVPPLLPLDAHMHDEEAEARRLHNIAIEIGDLFGVAVHPITVRARDAATAILEELEHSEAELVVIGASRRTRLNRRTIAFGHTVQRVLRRAPCRVMVVASAPLS